MRCYGHVLRKEDVHILRTALQFEVRSQRKKRSQKITRKKQVEDENMMVGFGKEDVRCRSKLIVNQIATRLG